MRSTYRFQEIWIFKILFSKNQEDIMRKFVQHFRMDKSGLQEIDRTGYWTNIIGSPSTWLNIPEVTAFSFDKTNIIDD